MRHSVHAKVNKRRVSFHGVCILKNGGQSYYLAKPGTGQTNLTETFM